MEGFGHLEQWNLFKWFGIDNPLLLVNAHTIINTWIVLLVLALIIIICRVLIARNNKIVIYFLTSFVLSFKDLVTQALGAFSYKHFAFIISIFTFIILCNWISIIPFVEEPTGDLNTALALGLISFFYKEFYAIYVNGFKAYIKEFFHPFFLMFPLNLISHFSKIISISFRLFGNIYGGSIILSIYLGAISTSALFELFGLFSGLNYLVLFFFVIFEGLIQAFVFTMLSLTYLAIAVQEEHGSGELAQ